MTEDLRKRLAAANARPSEEEMSLLLPVLKRRVQAWQALEHEDLGETPPGVTFTPLVDDP